MASRLAGSSGCQNGGDCYTPFSYPWRGDEYQDDKTVFFQTVRENRYAGHPTRLSDAVRAVYGDGYTNTEYRRLSRFAERCEWFQIERRDGFVSVEPTPACFNLRRQKANAKTTGRRRGGLSNGESSGESGDDDGRDSPVFAKERVQSYLDRHTRFNADSLKRDVFGELVREIESTTDKYKILAHRRRDEYLLLPYATRFNDETRALNSKRRLETALGTAADEHNDAVMLTLTTDPKRFDGLSDALEALYENKARLLSWLATDYQLGFRPDSLTVLEFTESGLPHVHLVLFGVSWVVSQEALSAKWSDLGQGRVVDVRQVSRRNETWILHDDDLGRTSLYQYLGKQIRELVDLAGMDKSDLRAKVEDGDLDLWRHALFWATKRQYCSASPSLKESKDDDGLPHVPTWEFVGAAEYRQIPTHIRESAVLADRPPPAGGGRQRGRGTG